MELVISPLVNLTVMVWKKWDFVILFEGVWNER